ncbi:hypothetical protein HELRODRAFT_184249 [Helobdella robusta]|uniref:Uncharacterized protein n=1 Tax=Helobdella robusta TaxID=6412 RepID=T1FKU7_HELRO|nr:hypothetical protein HELRODRAFT_184249 [Helobdella robusta]ESO04144.1 hypothetical protein HELRODRAFT_184249 [Helobdella robusta]
MPINLVYQLPSNVTNIGSHNEFVDEIQKSILKAHQLARERLKAAAMYRKLHVMWEEDAEEEPAATRGEVYGSNEARNCAEQRVKSNLWKRFVIARAAMCELTARLLPGFDMGQGTTSLSPMEPSEEKCLDPEITVSHGKQSTAAVSSDTKNAESQTKNLEEVPSKLSAINHTENLEGARSEFPATSQESGAMMHDKACTEVADGLFLVEHRRKKNALQSIWENDFAEMDEWESVIEDRREGRWSSNIVLMTPNVLVDQDSGSNAGSPCPKKMKGSAT